MGETALDEDTFDEYLIEMRNHYTAEKVRFHSKLRMVVDPDDNFSITYLVQEKTKQSTVALR